MTRASTTTAVAAVQQGTGEAGATASARGERSVLPSVRTLIRRATSAYHARLFADVQGVVLVTPEGFVLLRDGEPPREVSVPLGFVAARQGDSILFWRSGWLRQVALSGEEGPLLAALPRAPQHLLASDSRIAWIDTTRDGGASLQTLRDGRVRVVHESRDGVHAAALRDAVVYWIQQSRDGAWRVGSLHLDGQQATLTPARRGRPPALLAPGPDGVYFYDGPARGVRRLTFELDREDAVSSGVICSPLVVSDRAVCAQIGGLFAVPRGRTSPRFLASEREGAITALAATEERAFWVTDTGADRLVVRTAPLGGP